MEKKIPELLINCKNAVAMTDIYQFKGHTGSAFHGIFIAAGGAETAFTAERDKLKLSAVWTAIHGATKGGKSNIAYSIWNGIYIRCYKDKRVYEGATMCDLWKNDKDAFAEWWSAEYYECDMAIMTDTLICGYWEMLTRISILNHFLSFSLPSSPDTVFHIRWGRGIHNGCES